MRGTGESIASHSASIVNIGTGVLAGCDMEIDMLYDAWNPRSSAWRSSGAHCDNIIIAAAAQRTDVTATPLANLFCTYMCHILNQFVVPGFPLLSTFSLQLSWSALT